MRKIKRSNYLKLIVPIVFLSLCVFRNISYATDSTNNEHINNLYHSSSEAINVSNTESGESDSSDRLFTLGFFGDNIIGVGFSGEFEWKGKVEKRKSVVLNLGVRNNENSYSYEYSYGLSYLLHNGDYKNSLLWAYEGLSLIAINKRVHIGIPLGLRLGLKDFVNIYLEAMPMISDIKSYISFGFGIRMGKMLNLLPGYAPMF